MTQKTTNKLETKKYELQISLSFQVDAESLEKAQELLSEKILSGQLKLAVENDLQIVDISGQVKAV